MLALPFSTGPAGFLPALTVTLLCWLYMFSTGLLFMEATLWLPAGSNYLSITGTLLGKGGRWVAGIVYLYLYYCLLVAYWSLGSPLLSETLGFLTGWAPSPLLSNCIFTLFFGLVIFLGARVTDRLNFLLMVGLFVSYLALLGKGGSRVDEALLSHTRWGLALPALPTLFSAFGYHNMIPTVATYLGREPKRLLWAIFVGTFITLVIYALWQWMIIGILPAELIEETKREGLSITLPLEVATGSPWISNLARFFALFALTTSLLGVSLSLLDFMGDGLKISRKKGWGRLSLTLLVFLPPAFLAALFPGLFFRALAYAGGFGEAILNGLLPIGMVWVGVYLQKRRSALPFPGGRFSLALLFLFTLLVIGYEGRDLLFHLLERGG